MKTFAKYAKKHSFIGGSIQLEKNKSIVDSVALNMGVRQINTLSQKNLGKNNSLLEIADIKYSYKDIFELAKNAKDYARTKIVKGGTQLENNNLSREDANALSEGVKQLQFLSQEIFACQERLLDASLLISLYENVISLTNKHSLGNCGELAYQAFDYILYASENLHTRADVYEIKGGDHIFLVLNRPYDSDPYDPKTWGNETIICDPWANAVYNALDYQSKLKNFYSQNNKNYIEDFDSNKHSLIPCPNMNTEFFQKYRNIQALQLNFKKKCDGLLQTLEEDKITLSDEDKSLSKIIDQSIIDINTKIKNIKIQPGDYRAVKEQLVKVFDEIFDKYTEARELRYNQNMIYTRKW
jgi:hypothetical protein